tara:strand:+ start:3292 stop:3531 length:240 start_codon:yes stop_codon:yes gene_type:complete
MFIFGKIKMYIIAALALAMPIIYVMGRLSGANKEKQKVLKDDLQAANKKTDFYKAMAEHEDDPALSTRDGIINRVRNGL